VDAPGFDNAKKSDTEVLKMVHDWLKTTYVFVAMDPLPPLNIA
jgi:hypothetical protein